MRLGIFAKTFPGTEPHAVLAAVRSAGYGLAHYNMACSGLPSLPDTISVDMVERIRKAVATTQVSLCGLSATWNMIHPDAQVRRTGLARCEVLAAAAVALGIPVLTLCTGTRDPDNQWRHHPDNTSVEAWADLRSSMESAIAIAERHDLVLGVEPETANIINGAAAARQLLDEMATDRIGIVIDPANLFHQASAAEQKGIVAGAVDLLGDHIIMAHAKDQDSAGHNVAPGQGVIDFAFLFQKLRSAGFDGPVITHGLEASAATAARRHLEECL